MHARSITFHGKPDKIDAGIAFVTHEAVPLLDTIDGCRGISLLADRSTGHCIVTSSWESAKAMQAGNERLRPLRDRGRDILGATMEIDEWEIAVMHRSAHGASCRVTWMQGDADAMKETVRAVSIPALEAMQGFCSASLLVNRDTGLACITTCWESPGDMGSSRAAADELHTRTAAEAGGEVVEGHEFDLAYAHLNVPQMA